MRAVSDFAADAIQRGAVAVVSDMPPPASVSRAMGSGAGRESRRWPCLAAEFYEHPSRSMSVVGITGTNGKTTTAYLLRARIRSGGKEIGTAGHGGLHGGRLRAVSASRTTPEAPDVQRMFRLMVDRGCARVRDGSLVARACARTSGRNAVCCGRVHEPDAGPPRLSQATWRVTSRRSGDCSRCSRRARQASSISTIRAANRWCE